MDCETRDWTLFSICQMCQSALAMILALAVCTKIVIIYAMNQIDDMLQENLLKDKFLPFVNYVADMPAYRI